jgi:hypothetical protein
MIACGMQDLLRGAAEALANLSEKAHQWADQAGDGDAGIDPGRALGEFAGVDIVGIDFSTSIQQVASHVIRGWDLYRYQVDGLRRDYGVRAFGVNAIPFPLTRGPVPPRLLPSFREEHFQRRGCGRGLIEYGSAFYDYFLLALGYAQELGVFDEGSRVSVPLTISLLCDGFPNGGTYQAKDVRPLLEAARARGVRFKLVAITQLRYWRLMLQFSQSLGLTCEELEVLSLDEGISVEQTFDTGFHLLSSIRLDGAGPAAGPPPVRAAVPDGVAAGEGDPPPPDGANMTPEEWNRCEDPQQMLEFLRDSHSWWSLVQPDSRRTSRQLRLFACACCRRMGPLLRDERSRRAIETAERFADELASVGEMAAAAYPVPVAVGWVTERDAGRAALMAADAAAFALAAQPTSSPWPTNRDEERARQAAQRLRPGNRRPPQSTKWDDERAAQAAILRCIFAPVLFHPVTIPGPVLAWGGGAARRLAETIYGERRFEDLPILADLLEAAGCADAELLGHLRGPGPHAKGCYALDAVLGKS